MLAALLRFCRRASAIGAAFTGFELWIAISRGDSGGVALYALLFTLCVIGLAVKTADKRPTV